jgi:membrane-anchored glycerophosphoryl diester phosphodiesterase (GDPDase)
LVSLAFTALQLVFVAPFLTALFAKLTSDMYVGAPSDVRTAYRFAVMRIGPILLVTILTGLAVLGGVLLLIVPAFLFYVRFAFASAVVVIEDEHGRGAMRRSWRLARGRFWPLFGTLLLASVLAGIVAGVATVPLTFAAEYIGPSGWPLAAVGSALAAIVTRPFVIVVTVLLYFDLRIRKEGFDLDVQVEQLRLER